MNDESGLASRPRPQPPDPRRAYHAPATDLQVWLDSLFVLLLDARDELDDVAYTAFLFIATERLGIESARLLVGEAIRARADRRQAA